jgi:biotin---protein ligase
MNVLVCASSASHGLSNALRSVLSPFYTVQSVLPVSLATQPWTVSCALLVLLPPLSLPGPAHEAVQQYISAGGRILGIGTGATLLPHRQVQERFLWDARSGTAIVPQYPQAVPTLSPPSSILLQTGTLLSGLRRASVPFVLTSDASDVEVIRGRWEEPVGAIAGIQVPVGSGRAAFWGISPCFDGTEDTENVTSLLRYVLTSLGLSVPPAETTATATANESSNSNPLFSIPKYALPQFLLHPRGKRHISETILHRLGVSVGSSGESESEPVVIKDRVDTFHIHKVASLEHGARLVAEAKANASAAEDGDVSGDAPLPRLIVVLPPDVIPTGEQLTPRFDAEKYFAVLAEVRRDQISGAERESWGVGEALIYGEAVTSTQMMLERYATPCNPVPSRPPFPDSHSHSHPRLCLGLGISGHPKMPKDNTYIETPNSWRPSKPRSSRSQHFSSLGAAAVPTRGSRQRDACNSPSSSARHYWVLWASPRRASSSYSTSLGWPSSARAATSARWAPSGVHA